MKSLTILLSYIVLFITLASAANCSDQRIPGSNNFYYTDSFASFEVNPDIQYCNFSVRNRSIYCKKKSGQSVNIPINYNSGCEYCNKSIKSFIIWEKTNGRYHTSNQLFDKKNKNRNVQEKHFQITFSNSCTWNAGYAIDNIKIGI